MMIKKLEANLQKKFPNFYIRGYDPDENILVHIDPRQGNEGYVLQFFGPSPTLAEEWQEAEERLTRTIKAYYGL